MAKKLINNSEKLLNYIINENPTLRMGLKNELQNKNLRQIGDLIVKSDRYRNAFINTVNLIAVTIIDDDEAYNAWENFTEQGEIRFGQSVRELILDLVEAQDYNEHMNSATHFLETEVPNLMNYFHDLNFQKFYKTTVNVDEISLAFDSESGLYDLIEKVYKNLRKSYMYDRYLVDKYQVQRRIINGTVPSVAITHFDTNDIRENVAILKEYSNNMLFMNNKYNPAGAYRQTPFTKQRTILSTGFEARLSTMVLATSYYKDEAEMRSKLALIDGFANNDWGRLAKLLGDQYTAFTDTEIEKLSNVIAMTITDEWFKDYKYIIDNEAEFTNPESKMRNMWLHVWRIFSTSPFEQCIVFTKEASGVDSVSVSPSTATVTKGQSLNLKASVVTEGITNKSVYWDINKVASDNGATIDQTGELKVPEDFDTTGTGTAGVYTINVATALAEDETIKVNGVTYTVAAADDTAAKQGAALRSALNVAAITDYYAISGSGANAILTEKSGLYGQVGEPTVVATTESGEVTVTETTPGVIPDATIIVTATSIFDKTVSGTAKITVS